MMVERKFRDSIIYFLFTLLAFLLSTVACGAQENQEQLKWEGTLANGKLITDKSLGEIIQQHKMFIVDSKKGNRADFSKAELKKVNLSKVNLSEAIFTNAVLDKANLSKATIVKSNFSGATLIWANLSEAMLNPADLSGAKLWFTNLSGANLYKATFNKADLWKANLNGAFAQEAKFIDTNLIEATLQGARLNKADLSKANLDKADIRNASLRGAILTDGILIATNIKDADFSYSDLSNVLFEPKPEPIPFTNAYSLSTAKNLTSLRYENSAHGLIELRESFKIMGFKKQEREVTYAIKHSEIEKLLKEKSFGSKISAYLQIVLFEWTCKWGLQPFRCLKFFSFLIIIFWVPYLVAVLVPGEGGIWKIWPPDSINKNGEEGKSGRLRFQRTIWQWKLRAVWIWVKNIVRYFIWYPLIFSILSAFHIGWRELNVGNWITRILPYEYTFKATGWPKIFSGIQSLISVYLIALWALTYFGNPFNW